MNEAEAKRHLLAMLASYTPGTLLHFLAQVIREAEESTRGGRDARAQDRVREAEPFLWIAGYGLMAALPH
jgi:hypothetical protein